MKPLIGVIPDYKSGGENQYSIRPHYAVRVNYCNIVSNSGGVPLILTYDYNLIDDYLKLCDGLLFVGGNCDIHPKRYNEDQIHKTVSINEVREDFEWEFMQRAMASTLPILGICNGMQLMNVISGGSLIQHIPDEDPQFMNHEQSSVHELADSHLAYHKVNILTPSKLDSIIGRSAVNTNSSHHQAIKNVGQSFVVSARADDGIIEAIEKEGDKYCLGIQWHPEFEVSEADRKIFKSFIQAATSSIKN